MIKRSIVLRLVLTVAAYLTLLMLAMPIAGASRFSQDVDWSTQASNLVIPQNHPVILIHGMGGKASDWDETSVWQALKDNGYNMDLVRRFAYPLKPGTNEEDSQGDVVAIADKLANDVDILSRDSIAVGGSAQVDLIGYSLGGPIARSYLNRYSGSKIGKLIEMGAANDGSYWLGAYHRLGRVSRIQKAIYDAVDSAARQHNMSLPDPDSTAAKQMIPGSDFLKDLNQPQKAPRQVDYHCLYGDISTKVVYSVFDIEIRPWSGSIGDGAISASSATYIPGVGKLGDPDSSNYHTYRYPASATLRVSPAREIPFLEIDNLPEFLQAGDGAWHWELGKNTAVKQQILAILSGAPTQPPIGGGATTTALIIDISGSMSESWKGGRKIESAKSAALNVVALVEQESKAGGGAHQLSIVSFSTNSQVELPPGTDYNAARRAITRLSPQANTNIGAGVDSANKQLQSVPAGVPKIMVLMTDGLNNTGMSNDQVLNGPVRQAAIAGTCIFAIGFGDKGKLDENFLRQIARASSCGHYYYASSGVELQNIYVRSRHQALGTIVAEFKGQVKQGQMVTLGQVPVQPNQAALYATLNWPGSRLDLIVVDPSGQRVDQNYPDAMFSVFERLVYLIVNNPRPGVWTASISGRDVPEGTTDYNAIFSTRVGPPSIPPSPNTGLMIVLVVIIAMLTGGIITLAFVSSKSSGAMLYVADGQAMRSQLRLNRSVTYIGRDPRSALVIPDPQVSARHAQITRQANVYILYDLNSTNGTFVNSARVRQHQLQDRDRIRIGNTELLFRAAAMAAGRRRAVSPYRTPAAGEAYLSGKSGPRAGSRLHLKGPVTTLGRDSSCDIALSDAQVSRRHAEIRIEASGYVLYDTQSVNGTLVNNERISRHLLREGDQIRIGQSVLIFHKG